MSERPEVQKAKIVSVNDTSQEVVCHFNPEDFEISRTIEWPDVTSQGKNAPRVRFGGGKANDLTIPLLFDTTATGGDVRESYQALLNMSMIDESNQNTATGKGQPPLVRFEWGMFLSFEAVITTITQKFLMFKADGTPLRARVSVTFKQVEQVVQPQNPTSRSEARKIRIVHEGETLDWIAYQEYGNPAHWRHIAETNNLDNPRALYPGQVLKLIPLSS
jgi:LysM repeat protein